MQQQQIALQAAQARLQAASQLGDLYSAAFLLHDPEIKMKALSYGYSPEQISSMPLQQQAALAQGIVNSMILDLQRQETQLNNRYVLARILSQEMANEEFRQQLEQMEQASKAASKTSSSSSSSSSSPVRDWYDRTFGRNSSSEHMSYMRPPITIPASRLFEVWNILRR